MVAVSCHWEEFTLDLIGRKGWWWLQWRSYCVGVNPMEQDSLKWDSGVCGICPSDVSLVEVVGWCSGVVWSCPLDVLVLRPVRRDSGAGQGQLLPVSCQRLPMNSKSFSDGCCLFWVWGHLARGMGHTEARCCLFGICEHLRNFRKVDSMSQDKPFVTKSHWKWLRCAHTLGGAVSQGVTRVREWC